MLSRLTILKYTFLVLLIACFSACKFITNKDIVVQDVEPLNMVYIEDETGNYPPYFKLCNQSNKQVSIGGLSLLKNLATNKLFVFPDKQLQADSCIIVFLSGKNRDYVQLYWENLLANNQKGPWRIKHTITPDDQLRQLIFALEVPVDKLNYLNGRFKINGEEIINVKPIITPINRYNVLVKVQLEGKAIADIIKNGQVIFDIEFAFNEPFPMYLLAGYKNKETAEKPPKWLQGASYNMHTNFTVKPGKDALTLSNASGEIIAQFIIPGIANSKAIKAIKSMPKPNVHVNTELNQYYITTKEEWLYNKKDGLLTMGENASKGVPYFGANFWKDRKIPGLLYKQGEEDATLIWLKVHGNYSRMLDQKSISYKPLQGDEKVTKIFRNAGQDNLTAHLRNALAFKIAGYEDFSSPILLNAGGKNLGCYHLQTKINEHYLQVKYSVPSAEINLLESGQAYPVLGSSTEFLNLIKQLEDRKISPAELKTHFDIEKLIEHFAINIFIGNADWPHNNIRFWNSPDNNIKWTYELYDCDISFGLDKGFGPMVNDLQRVLNATDNYHSLIFRTLLKDEEFKTQFVEQYTKLIEGELNYMETSLKLDKLKKEMEPCMKEHLNTWASEMYNYKIWEKELEKIDAYLKERPSYAKRHLQQALNTIPLTP